MLRFVVSRGIVARGIVALGIVARGIMARGLVARGQVALSAIPSCCVVYLGASELKAEDPRCRQQIVKCCSGEVALVLITQSSDH